MAAFNGSWKCIHRENDSDMMKVMKIPQNLIDTFVKPEFDPVYTFSIKNDQRSGNPISMDFIESWPNLNTMQNYRSMSPTFG